MLKSREIIFRIAFFLEIFASGKIFKDLIIDIRFQRRIELTKFQ